MEVVLLFNIMVKLDKTIIIKIKKKRSLTIKYTAFYILISPIKSNLLTITG